MSTEAPCSVCGIRGYHSATISTVRGPEQPLCQDCSRWGRTASEAGGNLEDALELVVRQHLHLRRLIRAERLPPGCPPRQHNPPQDWSRLLPHSEEP